MFGSSVSHASATSQPKTVLGFFGVVLAILTVALIAVVGWLITVDDLRDTVGPVLIVYVVLVVSLVGGVTYMMLRHPEKLQLGQVNAEEYLRITQGDSTSGEVSAISAPPGGPALPKAGETPAIEASAEEV